MANTAQSRALKTYRDRLGARGLARFEILAPEVDRELIRSLARKLTEGDLDAERLRSEVSQAVTGEPTKTGGILAALRRSPLVGADLNLTRSTDNGRAVDL